MQWLESNQINVTRQVKNSISIENPYEGAKRPIRLEGEIYEQGFRATGEYRQEVQQRIEEYRGTTSERYRTNVTDYQRQLEHKSQYHCDRYPQSDEKIAQSIQNNAQTVEKQLSLYQTLLQSKLSHLTQLNEQIQSQEQQAQNQAVQKKLTTLNMGLISVAVILLIAIFSLGLVTKNKYSEMQTLNTVINEKQ